MSAVVDLITARLRATVETLRTHHDQVDIAATRLTGKPGNRVRRMGLMHDRVTS
ncbi:hypothetical protein [Streptomyces sp. LN704]|uniref:hypothetical protein n=1 Tax=unclassified Streptomyces TaxID=2593676 RepID=UPI00371EEB17